MVKETCVLTFATSRGGRKIIRIANPRPNIQADQVMAGAINVLGGDLFDSTVGRLEGLATAEVVTQTTTRLLPRA